MLAIDEITELRISKKNGLVTMELKFLCKEGTEHNLIIEDEINSNGGDESKPVVKKRREMGRIETESGYLLYKYSYPLRNYLIDLFGWK